MAFCGKAASSNAVLEIWYSLSIAFGPLRRYRVTYLQHSGKSRTYAYLHSLLLTWAEARPCPPQGVKTWDYPYRRGAPAATGPAHLSQGGSPCTRPGHNLRGQKKCLTKPSTCAKLTSNYGGIQSLIVGINELRDSVIRGREELLDSTVRVSGIVNGLCAKEGIFSGKRG